MHRMALAEAEVDLSREAFTSRWLEETGIRMAHELKNALCAVRALAQLGQRNPTEAASHERLARIEAEVTRMEEILRRHLSPARSGREDGRAPGRTG